MLYWTFQKGPHLLGMLSPFQLSCFFLPSLEETPE